MNKVYIVIFLALLSVVLVSGCVTDWFGQDVLKINDKTVEVGFKDILEINTVRTEPSSPLLTDMKTTLMFIIKNKDELKPAKIVTTQLFDAVNFKNPNSGTKCNIEECKTSLGLCSSDNSCNVLPGEEKLIEYDLQAPSTEDIANVRQESNLQFKVNYDFKASMIYDAVIINMDEVKRRQRAGETLNIDRRTVMGSGPVQIDIQLYNNPYILAGREAVFIFKVKNLGDKTKGTLKDSKIPAQKMKITFPQGLITKDSEILPPSASSPKDAPATGQLTATGMAATPAPDSIILDITFKDNIIPKFGIRTLPQYTLNDFGISPSPKEGTLRYVSEDTLNVFSYAIDDVGNGECDVIVTKSGCEKVWVLSAHHGEKYRFEMDCRNLPSGERWDRPEGDMPPGAGTGIKSVPCTPSSTGTCTPPGTTGPASGNGFFTDQTCTNACTAINKQPARCVDQSVLGFGPTATCSPNQASETSCKTNSAGKQTPGTRNWHCCCGIKLPTTGSEVVTQPLFNCKPAKGEADRVCTNSLDIELYAGESMPLYFRVSNTSTIPGSPYKTFIVLAEADYTYELRSSMAVVITPY